MRKEVKDPFLVLFVDKKEGGICEWPDTCGCSCVNTRRDGGDIQLPVPQAVLTWKEKTGDEFRDRLLELCR